MEPKKKKKVMILVESPLGLGNISMVYTTIRHLQMAGADVVIVSGMMPEKLGAVMTQLRAMEADMRARGKQVTPTRIIELPIIEFDSEKQQVMTTKESSKIDEQSLEWGRDGIKVSNTPLEQDTNIQRLRAEKIRHAIEKEQPDAVACQFYPVGRSYLDTEMQYVLRHAKKMRKPPLIVSLLRDIYFETERNQEKRAQQGISAEQLLKDYFDYALVFSDPDFIELKDSWEPEQKNVAWDVNRKIIYAGFSAVKPPAAKGKRQAVLITGGGHPVEETVRIYKYAIEALSKSKYKGHPISIIMPESEIGSENGLHLKEFLTRFPGMNIKMEAISQEFRARASSAALVISQGGYNQTLEMIQTDTPTVLVPRLVHIEDDHKEQTTRVNLVAEHFAPQIAMADSKRETPKDFAHIIDNVKLPEQMTLLESARLKANKQLVFNGGKNAAAFILEQVKEREKEVRRDYTLPRNMLGMPELKPAIVGIDIGGTKIDWAVYERKGDELAACLGTGHRKTRRAKAEFVEDLQAIVTEAARMCGKTHRLITVGVGFPVNSARTASSSRGRRRIWENRLCLESSRNLTA